MIEMMILAMIASVVVKRGAEDLIHSARGGTPPRYAAASARRKSGAAARYWGQLWDDVWNGASAKRAARRTPAPSTPRPRGAATQFLAGLFQDGRRAAGRRWEDGWVRLDEKRRERATRPRPGQQTVPGTVVPNAPSRPEDEDRPEDRPRPEPHVVPDEDDSPVPVPQDEHTDPTGQDDESVPDYPPDSGPDNQTSSPLASTTTQEGTTMTTTIPSADVVGFEPILRWGDASGQGYRAMIGEVELCISKLTQAKVTDGALHADLASVMELTGSAAAAMDSAMAKLAAHRIVAEAYHAAPGAGEKEFMLNG